MSSVKERIRQKIQAKQDAARQEALQRRGNDPLFDNPVFQEMKSSLPVEEQKRYEEMGQHMYGNLDEQFNAKGEFNAAVETVAQLKVMLQSGMHPSFLSKDEREFLENYLGKEWYKEFGYLEADVNRINF